MLLLITLFGLPRTVPFQLPRCRPMARAARLPRTVRSQLPRTRLISCSAFGQYGERGTAAGDRPNSAAPLSANGDCGMAAGDPLISADSLPANGEGGMLPGTFPSQLLRCWPRRERHDCRGPSQLSCSAAGRWQRRHGCRDRPNSAATGRPNSAATGRPCCTLSPDIIFPEFAARLHGGTHTIRETSCNLGSNTGHITAQSLIADRPRTQTPADSPAGRQAPDTISWRQGRGQDALPWGAEGAKGAPLWRHHSPNSAAPLPANGEGGTSAGDPPIGTPDDALALRGDALSLFTVVDTAFFNKSGLHSACLFRYD